MDLNREMGMTTMTRAPTNCWSEAATKTVQVQFQVLIIFMDSGLEGEMKHFFSLKLSK